MKAYLKWFGVLLIPMLGLNYFVEPPLANMHRSYLAAKQSQQAAARLDTLRQTEGELRFLAELLLGNPLVPEALSALSKSLQERHPIAAHYLETLPLSQDSLLLLLRQNRSLDKTLNRFRKMDAEQLRQTLTENPELLHKGLNLSLELSRTPGSFDEITQTLLQGLDSKKQLAADLQQISRLTRPTQKNTAALHQRALLCILFSMAGALFLTTLLE